MKAFHMEMASGVTYWVAAKDWAEALAIWARMEADNEEALAEICDGIEMTEATAEQLQKAMILDDGTDSKVSLQELLASTVLPQVLACSEWP